MSSSLFLTGRVPTLTPKRSLRLNAKGKEEQQEAKYPQDEAPKPWADPTKNPRFNVIPKSRWEKGIPVVMGGHLTDSGIVAPISRSSGVGTGPAHIWTYQDDLKEFEAEVLQYTNPAAASTGLAETIFEAYKEAVARKGAFSIALPGGSVIKALPSLLRRDGIDWSKWHVFFVDERNVEHSSPDSNFGAAQAAFLAASPIPAPQIRAIAEGLTADQAAIAYEAQLLTAPPSVLPKNDKGVPQFDLILLGIGPDGHVASLFPNRAATAEKVRAVVGVTNSPKPPSERITFTLPVINAAKNVIFYAVGKDKAEVVQRTLEVQALPGAIPAQLVRPLEGKLRWILDLEAVANINPALWTVGKHFPRNKFAGEAPAKE